VDGVRRVEVRDCEAGGSEVEVWSVIFVTRRVGSV
jgi:hypothetical protein